MSTLQEIEQARQKDQERLDARMGLEERNRSGQFATPNSLALEIMKYAWRRWQQRRDRVRFLEPALGTGSFYSALLQVFPPDLVDQALGIERNAEHAKAARALWGVTDLQVVYGDFTTENPPDRDKRFNLVVTNPPYVRHHHVGRETKERLQAVVLRDLGIKISGLAGLYCYFLLLADRWLAGDGLPLWLVPSEFMDVNYGTAVKRYLTESVKLLHVHRFCPADVQFDDALVSSAVVVFEKSAPPPGHKVLFSLGGSLLEPQAQDLLVLRELRVGDKWTQYPHSGEPKAVRKTAERKLGDLFTIKCGLATGANDFFILERAAALAKGIPKEFLRPILPNPRQLPGTVIEGGEDGYPLTEPQLALIDCALPEEQLRKKFPAFWSYLEGGKKRKIHEGYLTSRRSPWYSQEDRPPAPFLCTYMGRSQNGRKPFRFLWNRSAATAHNVYLLLYPKGPFKTALAANPVLYGMLFEALQAIDTDGFMGEGRVYGGGLYKMEPKELARISAESVFTSLKDYLKGTGMELYLPFS
jgi:hypothetical protein